MEVYKKHICSSLRKIKSTQGKNELSEIRKDTNENKASSEKCESEDFKKLLSEFDCPICFEIMASPKRIYACSNNHFICSLCLFDTKIRTCPICRESFNVKKPLIQHTSERILEILLQNENTALNL